MTTREQVWWDAFELSFNARQGIKFNEMARQADTILAEFDKRFAKREEGREENQPYCGGCLHWRKMDGYASLGHCHMHNESRQYGHNCQHFKPKEG